MEIASQDVCRLAEVSTVFHYGPVQKEVYTWKIDRNGPRPIYGRLWILSIWVTLTEWGADTTH